jgi:hypothetical protein
VSPKRGDRVAPPPSSSEWDLRFGDSAAANGWEELCRHVPGNTLKAWHLTRSSPGLPETERDHRLRGELATRKVGGQELDQWQLEVTGGGRIWYCLDEDQRRVWVVFAGTGHPPATA